LRGTVTAPSFGGSLTLAGGAFSGPQETVPITGARGTLAFSGTTIAVQGVSADVGGGKVTSSGTIAIPDVHDLRSATVALQANASNARVDLPAYLKGTVDAALTIARDAGAPPRLGGTIALSKARVPVSAFTSAKPAGASTSTPPDVILGLALTVGDDVRVISPSVDVGGSGKLTVSGTLAKPAIDGRITSTGGTLDFYRHFRLQRAVIAFDPSSGIIPDVNATATTMVTDPDTTIQLHVTGPANDLNIGLASDPAYTREQILGLLVGVQQFGALAGVQSTGGGSFSAGSAAQQLALGQVNGVFTKSLLEPLSSQIASVVGLQDFSIYNDIGTGFGLNLGKSLGKNLSVSAAESFGVNRQTSISLIDRFTDRLRGRLTFYQSSVQVFAASLPTFGTPQTVGQTLQLQNNDLGTGFRIDGELKF
jgi:translocation and assembly module TamB